MQRGNDQMYSEKRILHPLLFENMDCKINFSIKTARLSYPKEKDQPHYSACWAVFHTVVISLKEQEPTVESKGSMKRENECVF